MPHTPPDTLDHHFLEGRRYRADELGEHIAHKNWWRVATFAAIGGMILLGMGNVIQGAQKKDRIFYIVERASGELTYLGQAPTVWEPNTATIHLYLRELIGTLRSILLDQEEMKRQWRLVMDARLTKGGRVLLAQYEETFKPLAQRTPVKVEVLRIFKRSTRTYDIRWQESHYNDKRELVSTETYSGLVTFQQRPPSNETERTYNPAGLFFDTWQWSKE